jgi:hypothetical protein
VQEAVANEPEIINTEIVQQISFEIHVYYKNQKLQISYHDILSHSEFQQLVPEYQYFENNFSAVFYVSPTFL